MTQLLEQNALLEHLAKTRSGCGIVRAAGMESEMELAYSGLHQLCAPLLDRLAHLPGPQREALATAFGLTSGEAADRLLVGLAVLRLLARTIEYGIPDAAISCSWASFARK